jgi:excisionase family DNA binding protein
MKPETLPAIRSSGETSTIPDAYKRHETLTTAIEYQAPKPLELNALLKQIAIIGEQILGLLTVIAEKVGGEPKAMHQQAQTEEWWTTDEVADYLKLSKRAVRDGATSGNLPAHKYPEGSERGVWRFRRSEIDQWLLKRPRQRQKKELSIY